MVVEINLLEQKEKRNILPYLVVAFFALLLLVLSIVFNAQKSNLVEESSRLDEQISQVKVEQESIATTSGGEGTEREQLNNSLEQLKGTVVPVIPVVEGLVSLLPERGFFESFALTGTSEITVNVRFDTIQEAAKYTNTLLQQSFISDVELAGVDTYVVDDTEDLYDYQPRYIASYYIVLEESTLTNEGVSTQ
ncbi:hypothetical protein [Halobacillus aidingensis]|uniref:Type IV pilus assembly protein PilN n=1 Tax=Halobacillus aidingensis TaxID=240303 RepID=A0A1H0P4X5_HALAD|nr:hypothetical protein [Halobacillus aidingensis]SDP00137.1 hypothetical protein SAMN05421677_11071 [Halobacillus aidingensis]